VYHDEGNLNWALIVPRLLHSQDAELAMVAAALSAQGFDAVPGPRGGLYCGPTSPHENKKLSGTARRFGTRNVLHHGTLLVHADMARLHASLGGIQTFDDRSLPSVPAAPLNLSTLDPSVQMEPLIQALSRQIAGVPPRPLPAAFADPLHMERETTKLASDEWIYNATAPFSVLLKGGENAASVRIEKGLVAAISGCGGDGDDSCLGRPFSYSLLEAMIEQILSW